MEAALPPWPDTASEVTKTRVRIRGTETIHVEQKPHDHPCSVRLHGDLILCSRSRRAAVREIDHRIKVDHVAEFTEIEFCSKLVHRLLAEAPATSEYDLAAENWVDSVHTPLDVAKEIARYVRDEFFFSDDDEDGEEWLPVPGLEFDIHLPELRVTFVYSEPCAICLSDVETEDKDAVTLPCSHLFHLTCITPWFHQASTCPTCRREITASATPEEFMQIGAEDESDEDEPLFLDDVAGEDENYIDFSAQDEEFLESLVQDELFIDHIVEDERHTS